MKAMDETQRASKKLRTEPTPESIDEFNQKADELCKRITAMSHMHKQGSVFPLEGLTERLGNIISGEMKTYRKEPR